MTTPAEVRTPQRSWEDAPVLDQPSPRGVRRKVAALALLSAVVVIGVGGWAVSRSAPPIMALGPPHFVDDAAGSGVTQAYTGDYPYVVGGGVAAFDCDDDRKPDLFLAGGTARTGLFRNVSDIGGSLQFEAIHDSATDLVAVTGAYPIDIDSDGHVDLVVLRLGESVILRGLGGCRFERANDELGLEVPAAWTVGFSAKWETSSGLPTLAFGAYLGLDASGEPTTDCDASMLVRPAADGHAYDRPTRLEPGYCALSLLFSDWDRSGRRDLRLSNDRHYYRDGEEQLWRIEPGQAPHLYTSQEGWATVRIEGMGIASEDLTGDGRPEVFLTSQSDNKLQTLVDGATGPEYHDIALRRNATVHTPYAGDTGLPSTAWHAEFADVNNDGLADLFVSKGNVGGQTEFAEKDPSNLLLGQTDGTFVEGAEAAGITRFGMARGAALVDLNLDGLLDLVQVVRNQNVELWRNVGTGDASQAVQMGHWVTLALSEAGANRDAIGAWVEVRVGDRTVQHEITVGGGHAGGQLGWIHVGLGIAASADVRVTWPDGQIGPWTNVAADRFVQLERGAGA